MNLGLDRRGSGARNQTQPARYSDQMPVGNDCGISEPDSQNRICGFASHAGQSQEFDRRLRHMSVITDLQKPAGGDQLTGFGAEEPDRPQNALDFSRVGGCQCCRYWKPLEQRGCEAIGHPVSALGGEDDRDQEPEGVVEGELALGGMNPGQPFGR